MIIDVDLIWICFINSSIDMLYEHALVDYLWQLYSGCHSDDY